MRACCVRRLKLSTLCLSVCLFDRFLAASDDVGPRMLQLLATACVHVAAKQGEATQPSPAEWEAIAGGV